MELLRTLAASLAVGILIGIERGWRQRDASDGGRVSGLRTFGLLGLIGGVAGYLPEMLAAVVGLAVLSSLVLGYRSELARQGSLSVTTTLVGIITFALGFVAAKGMVGEALATAAVTTLILTLRGKAHAMLKGMTQQEVESIARFALVALVILPLLPDANIGPWGAWNPRKIWMVVVVVLGLSFAGYVATRRLGPEKGIMITALCGSLVSSTAVTVAYARRLRQQDGPEAPLVAGIALASLVMFVRVQILSIALVPYSSRSLALAMVPAFIVGGLTTLLALRARGSEAHAGEVKLGNPLDFGPALLLAGLVAVMAIPARWALDRFGDQGIVVVLGLTGMWDVDAAVLTLAGMPKNVLDGATAGLVLAVPVLANTAFKAVLALGIAGPRRQGWKAAGPLFASVLASGAGIAGLLSVG
ncbi:MgtC/SapB family protein [Sphingobium sp. D43FB]|uniref:MgtC/SapB family protein n=1 Tax=Sphingobium sp. D43FB TaxID=2017595 RepID=UPI0020D075F5|nr:MgtC/SapB family protein [Sphingobium sp. D43FB]